MELEGLRSGDKNPYGIDATGYAGVTNSYGVVANCFAVDENQTLTALSIGEATQSS